MDSEEKGMNMETMRLSEIEARVVGVLAEKEATTPEYYPLSLNALVNACNQKSNRHPVMNLETTEVADAIERLSRLGLVTRAGGGRVARYGHNFPGKFLLEPETLAVLTELLLRGAQTPGELRSRAARMHPLEDLAAVEAELAELMEREPALVVRLPRQPGRKEHRYMHLLCGEPDPGMAEEPPAEAGGLRQGGSRVDRLEEEVAALRTELDALKQEFSRFRAEFD